MAPLGPSERLVFLYEAIILCAFCGLVLFSGGARNAGRAGIVCCGDGCDFYRFLDEVGRLREAKMVVRIDFFVHFFRSFVECIFASVLGSSKLEK